MKFFPRELPVSIFVCLLSQVFLCTSRAHNRCIFQALFGFFFISDDFCPILYFFSDFFHVLICFFHFFVRVCSASVSSLCSFSESNSDRFFCFLCFEVSVSLNTTSLEIIILPFSTVCSRSVRNPPVCRYCLYCPVFSLSKFFCKSSATEES